MTSSCPLHAYACAVCVSVLISSNYTPCIFRDFANLLPQFINISKSSIIKHTPNKIEELNGNFKHTTSSRNITYCNQIDTNLKSAAENQYDVI